MKKATQQGFTLIEIMIVVAIIGILASIAIPSYRDYVMRAYIVEATSELSSRRALMEQFYQDNRTYASAGPCTSVTVGKFGVSCTSAATTYTLTASGSGPVAGFRYTLNQQNTKTSATPWGNSNSCWVTTKGGSC
jgi:type IV pilus assembly protein PilE